MIDERRQICFHNRRNGGDKPDRLSYFRWSSSTFFPMIVGILLVNSGQAARAAKRETRVAARGVERNQAAKRSRLIAAAVATCCRRVLASPR